MKLKRIKAIAVKEAIQISRDPLSLALAFLLPVLLLFIFGYALTFDVNNLSTIIYDQDRSFFSRELVRSFTASEYFTISGYAGNDHDLDLALNSGTAQVALVIHEDFSKDLKSGRRPGRVQLILDGSDANTAVIALAYASSVLDLYTAKVTKDLKGITITPAIEPQVRMWYNQEAKSRNFIVPGLIAVIMMIIAALLTSLTVAREWERGTMEQLISTPVKAAELILGKMIPYFFIGYVDIVLAVVMGTTIFAVPFRGSLTVLMFCAGLFLFAGLGLGILISIVTKNQLLASQFALVQTFLPSYLLSGFMFSIANMPGPIQVLTQFFPATYFVYILKALFLKGSTFTYLTFQAFVLFLYGMIVFALANKKFKKRID